MQPVTSRRGTAGRHVRRRRWTDSRRPPRPFRRDGHGDPGTLK